MKAGDILRRVAFVGAGTLAGEIAVRFKNEAGIDAFTVVRAGKPVGVVTRNHLYAHRQLRRLWERTPASLIMNPSPIIVSQAMPLGEVSRLIAPLSREAL